MSTRRPSSSTLFPYTTLFRSVPARPARAGRPGRPAPGRGRRRRPRSDPRVRSRPPSTSTRSEEHTSELQSRPHLVCRLLLEKKKYHTNHVYNRLLTPHYSNTT